MVSQVLIFSSIIHIVLSVDSHEIIFKLSIENSQFVDEFILTLKLKCYAQLTIKFQHSITSILYSSAQFVHSQYFSHIYFKSSPFYFSLISRDCITVFLHFPNKHEHFSTVRFFLNFVFDVDMVFI